MNARSILQRAFVRRIVKSRWFLRTLNVPADQWPQLRNAAHSLGKPAVVLSGLLWATLLAAVIATGENDVLRDIFTASLHFATLAFIASSATQFLHTLFHTEAIQDAIAALSYAIWVVISLGVIGACSGFIGGAMYYRSTPSYAERMARVNCLDRQSEEIAALHRDRTFLDSDFRQCTVATLSDINSIELAYVEGRIDHQQKSILLGRVFTHCDTLQKTAQSYDVRIREKLDEKCAGE